MLKQLLLGTLVITVSCSDGAPPMIPDSEAATVYSCWPKPQSRSHCPPKASSKSPTCMVEASFDGIAFVEIRLRGTGAVDVLSFDGTDGTDPKLLGAAVEPAVRACTACLYPNCDVEVSGPVLTVFFKKTEAR